MFQTAFCMHCIYVAFSPIPKGRGEFTLQVKPFYYLYDLHETIQRRLSSQPNIHAHTCTHTQIKPSKEKGLRGRGDKEN
jgi:hypothetical protein